jgi:hypothetical protein
MIKDVSTWEGFLLMFFDAFTSPSRQTYFHMMTAWILATGRRTVCGMLPFLDSGETRAHDTFHRFFNAASWSMGRMWQIWTVFLVDTFYPEGAIPIDVDDTLFHKSGRKVEGAGYWRDAVRSTTSKVVYAWGLNLVVLTLRVKASWGGEPIGIPINVKLHRKGKNEDNLLELTASMIEELAEWLPERHFPLCGDGFFASMAGWDLPRTHVTSRIRHNAEIYDLPKPKKQKRRGAPRKKGERLACPSAMKVRSWKTVEIDERGKIKKRMVFSRQVLWYRVCKTQPIQLVISRDPEGVENDDYLFTTDLEASPESVIETYAGRWSIEDTFRNTKQFVGGQEPQVFKREGPERAASLSFLLYGMVWAWYILHAHGKQKLSIAAWYGHKKYPSFQDALSSLRKVIWRNRFIATSASKTEMHKNIETLISAAAMAA